MAEETIVTIDNQRYRLSDLAGEAQTQFNNVRSADTEIQNLERHLAIAKTARSAYAKALQQALVNISPIASTGESESAQ